MFGFEVGAVVGIRTNQFRNALLDELVSESEAGIDSGLVKFIVVYAVVTPGHEACGLGQRQVDKNPHPLFEILKRMGWS